ncbi:PAS domain S-box protein [Acetohalobium arabaticum]|uniref:Diguanylate cyclase with PAS/PAC sensor n=1 Tax=Acetohalobium arabaticum (strain ATCC 49924 / DSM 5501 / Z-7288) TaxID=574087 RepID=D9QSN0_ACEAZ|nr:PAS domain S-box protein [Acetohalobium arabaticum]ADL13493.1 diguanylate cyclase with PAS/PAC sensor [Acetohalobium arabaticum DSM 5501]
MEEEKSRGYFKSIISAVPDLIILFDEEGNYLDVWTSKAEDLVASKEKLIGKNIDEVLPNEVANSFKKYCSLAIDNDELKTYEYELEFEEGKRYFETHLVSVDAKDANNNEVLAVIRNITERKIVELELERASNKLELTVKGAKLGLWDWNIKTNRIETSKQCSNLLGYEPPNSFTHWKELIHEADKAKISQLIDKLLNGDTSYGKIEYRIKTEDNNYKWLQVIGKVVKWDNKGNPVRVLGILKDIDKRKQVEEELKRQRAYFQQLFNKSPNAIVLLDNEDRVIKVNKSFEQLFEYKQTNIKGEKINNLIIPEKNLGESIEKSLKVKEGEQVSDEVVRETKNSKKIYVEINAFPIKLNQGQIGVYGIYRNISKRKKEEARIKYLSFHDEMTGLYNRRYFENEIERLNNSRKLPISIIIGDMDGLKYINDNYGHKMGDEFIKKTAEAFKAATRQEDIVARIGGDEFAIILPEADSNTAQKICERIQAKTKWHNKKIDLPEPLRISLGYAVKIDRNQNLDEIFNKADQKMYQNKESRKYSPRDN